MKTTTVFCYISFLQLLALAQLCQGRSVDLQKFSPENYIIGGADADVGIAPFHVSIQTIFGENICGGAIISSQWIVTAGHCMEWPSEYLKVVTGTNNWKWPGAMHDIAEVKMHCLYNQPMYHNDIALLRLAKPIKLNKLTRLVKMAPSNYTLTNGDEVVLTGWGSTKPWGRLSDVLKRVKLSYMPLDECKSAVRSSKWVGDNHICSHTKLGEGSCTGDSGSPLLDKKGLLVGLVNWGEPCALGYPDVYASIAYFRSWIDQTIKGKTASEC